MVRWCFLLCLVCVSFVLLVCVLVVVCWCLWFVVVCCLVSSLLLFCSFVVRRVLCVVRCLLCVVCCLMCDDIVRCSLSLLVVAHCR